MTREEQGRELILKACKENYDEFVGILAPPILHEIMPTEAYIGGFLTAVYAIHEMISRGQHAEYQILLKRVGMLAPEHLRRCGFEVDDEQWMLAGCLLFAIGDEKEAAKCDA